MIIRPQDENWPTELDDLKRKPSQLYVRGRWSSHAKRVAIVGTRKSEPEAEEFAFFLAKSLGESGIEIVSGGALGIDSAAHRGALQSNRSIAVLAHGVTHAYPKENLHIFQSLIKFGCLVSEVLSCRLQPWLFLHRNRIIAALSQAVVIVQAPLRSGALSTALYALELNRKVLVVPASPWDLRSLGNLSIIDQAKLCCRPEDVLYEIGIERTCDDFLKQRRQHVIKKHRGATTEEYKVLEALSSRPRTIDELHAMTHMDISLLHSVLTNLMLKKKVEDRFGVGFVVSTS